jgi:hypothetical protein
MRNAPTNTDDIIDSRDVIERIEELTEERDALVDALGEAKDEHDSALCDLVGAKLRKKAKAKAHAAKTLIALEAARAALEAFDNSDEGAELTALTKLANEAEGYAADWKRGECLIRESYFTKYCQQLLEDCGDLPKDIPHYIVIDWDATARNLKVDYTEVDFDGVTYLIR